ncbi:MAG: hypothetical protein LBH78_02340 [Rickettsiales bacterium]|nr:hypothetical protein [Rickettsiales bacterium]
MMNVIATFFRLLMLLNIKEKIIKGIVKLKTSLIFKLTEYKKIFAPTGIKSPNKNNKIKTASNVNSIFSALIDRIRLIYSKFL